MRQIIHRKPANKFLRPSRAKPWQVPLQVIRSRRIPIPSLNGVVLGFAVLIACGTLLLILPISSSSGQITSPVNALFTATSAVCVTGLVVVDTGTYWSPFGQAVLLVLFQIGGFGFMTSVTIFFLATRRRIGLRDRLLIGETLGVTRPGGMVKIVRRAAVFTLVAESAGTIILLIRFLSRGEAAGEALWRALFHAVSAFNNCGMDIFGGFRSLLDYQLDPVILLTMAALIILGGIGYIVIDDLLRHRKIERLTTDTKIVLVTTLGLLALGTASVLLVEFNNPATIGLFSLPQKLLISFFQAVTPRTAGFSAVDIGKMIQLTLFVNILLMFIGGASGSTAGGIKVNTFGVLASTVISVIKGREHAGAFNREFDVQDIYRALSVTLLYLGLIGVVVSVLSVTEELGFVSLLFETFSAFGTVGLTTGITPSLSLAGRLIITAAMFVGRLGIITFLSILAERQQAAELRYPRDTIRIG